MSKLKLLILDANVVIQLKEIGLWRQVLERCDVHLAETVVRDEVKYARGQSHDSLIDLSDDIEQKCITEFSVNASDVMKFRDRFDDSYAVDLDPGETESLAYLDSTEVPFVISSGDKIVYRVLGNLGWEDRGISLEEILQRIGLGQSGLPWPASKAFREKYSAEGKLDFVQGRGRKGDR